MYDIYGFCIRVCVRESSMSKNQSARTAPACQNAQLFLMFLFLSCDLSFCLPLSLSPSIFLCLCLFYPFSLARSFSFVSLPRVLFLVLSPSFSLSLILSRSLSLSSSFSLACSLSLPQSLSLALSLSLNLSRSFSLPRSLSLCFFSHSFLSLALSHHSRFVTRWKGTSSFSFSSCTVSIHIHFLQHGDCT